MRRVAEIVIIRVRERRVRELGLVLVDLGDLFRVRNRRTPEEDGVDEAEDCRVRADAEGEGEHGDQREAHTFPGAAEGEADVGEEAIHEQSGKEKLRRTAVRLELVRGFGIMMMHQRPTVSTRTPSAYLGYATHTSYSSRAAVERC